LFEVPASQAAAAAEVIRAAMEQALPLSVPLLVECGQGRNWLEAH
jgi:DNA polymerase-1